MVALAAAAPAALGMSDSSCRSSRPGSGECIETTLEVDDVTVSDPTAPITLTAQLLTADGDPVHGARVEFGTTEAWRSDGAPASCGDLGRHRTNEDGVAEVTLEGGFEAHSGELTRLAGYKVRLGTIGASVDGVVYCWADARAAITVDA